MIDRRGLVLTLLGAGGTAAALASLFISPRQALSLTKQDLSAGCSAANPQAAQLDPELRAERRAQAGLPRACDPLWDMMHRCHVGYDAKTGNYTLTPTPEIAALDGTTVRARGFVLPLDGSDHTKHFLLGINTPVCFYHPPGEPNEVMEVLSNQPIAWNDRPMTMEGRFAKINNGELGVFFRLEHASPALG
ncbi:hypothetical protein MMA231_03607 (plasmid) [Asticcacaulis sp. MM231]|uniref:DUF3299 domain-containing protein n=1 Tax=Asticcacaulis sp. MM231 TaxID=3157666 RepID=UPI0032D5A8BA